MNSDYPNPWDFSNTDTNLASPNGVFKIEYGELYEIAMGAPLSGECFMLYGNERVKLNGLYGGPAIWNDLSTKLVLPVWTEKRSQKIAIVDVENMTISTYKKAFRVLAIQSFKGSIVTGLDSPIYMPSLLLFDSNKEEIEKTIRLQ